MSNKQSVAIIYGGKSVEHQISINSAKNVFEFIDKDKFMPLLIGISQEGKWYRKDTVDGNFEDKDLLFLQLDAKNGGFYHLASHQMLRPDIIFPVLHGTDGEDGSIQGLLRVLDIPFVGTGVLGSAVSMSKLYTKRLLQSSGIPIGKYMSFESYQNDEINFESMVASLELPFMAKAANLGSSVGVHKVRSESDFDHAVADVFKYDTTIIFEQYISGRELECSVIGNEKPEASLPAEIVISENYDFYTYEAKYLDPDAVKLEIPAKVGDDVAEKIRELSVKSYIALRCEDFARVDLFLMEDGEIVINEINTIPGFTNSSMFPMMWKERGISFTDLITKLIEMAGKRYAKSEHISNQFTDK